MSVREVTPEMLETIQSVGEEVINGEVLPSLLAHRPVVRAYDGFEPSGYGKMSIAQGLMRAQNVNKLTSQGVHFVFWVADWFAQMNHKMGGDLEKIRQAGQLMIETWRACGMDLDPSKVSFVWASDEINRRSDEYWPMVMDVMRKFKLSRLIKCTKSLGRESALIDTEQVSTLKAENYALQCELADLKGETRPEPPETQSATGQPANQLTASAILYAAMQCVDPFFLDCQILSLGSDQRKVTTLSIEYAHKCTAEAKANKKNKAYKRRMPPIVLHHHMLMGLDGSDKMSKSNPDNTIFMDDSPNEVKRKIKKAYCRPGELQPNPILEYCQYIIFPLKQELQIDRLEEHGGPTTYLDFRTIEIDFEAETLHPDDLKQAVILVINELLQPVRDHFQQRPELTKLATDLNKYQAKLMK